MIDARRYRGMTRAQVVEAAEVHRNREELRDLLDLQCARGTAATYYGRAEGAEYEYLLEVAVSPAADGLVCMRETSYEAGTRKAGGITFYDRDQAFGARTWVGRRSCDGMGSAEDKANACAWLDAWERIQHMIADRLRGESAKEGASA